MLFFILSGRISMAQDLDSAFHYNGLGKYDVAWQHLKKAVESRQPLPDKAAFLHGKLMYHQGKYTEAQAGLKKYLELAGNEAEFSEAANQILNLCVEQICTRCNNSGFFEKDATCSKCDSSGIVEVSCTRCQEGLTLCSSCNGRKFEKEASSMGVFYKDCSRCGGEGIISCPVCRGKKMVKKICTACRGSKKVKVKSVCEH